MEVPGRWIVFALVCLVILAYLAVSLLVIQVGLREARWDESWGVIPARYFGSEGRSQGEGAWHWGPLLAVLGVLHAFLFTLFQPFMLLDSSLGRMKWVATAMPATDLTPVEFRSRVSGLRQTVQQETKEEFQREIDEQNSLKNRKEEK